MAARNSPTAKLERRVAALEEDVTYLNRARSSERRMFARQNRAIRRQWALVVGLTLLVAGAYAYATIKLYGGIL